MATTSDSHAPNDSSIIEADNSDSYSDYSSTDAASSTASLISSVKEYVYENGRRYHTYWSDSTTDKYSLPTDEIEQDRLDMVHHAQLISTKGELFIAPVKNPQRILDCGTGTGIWALDVGDKFREAEVIGVDLSPIQPTWTAPNVRFQVDDLEETWTFKNDYFDFIHSRTLMNSIRDWPRYISQIYEHVCPGGYVELIEGENGIHCDDGTLTPDCALQRYFDAYLPACEKAGLKFFDGEKLKQMVEDAGFEDVKLKTYKIPWGPWPKNKHLKQLGTVMTFTLETGFQAYGLAVITNTSDMTREEHDQLCKAAFNDVRSRKVHGYMHQWRVVGRKPLKKE